jgi:deferrochelatase/peroxidase EfeB
LSTPSGLQEGIYYDHTDYPRNSFSIVFLRTREPFDSLKIRKTLSRLWKWYSNLKEVLVSDLDIKGKDPYHGTLTVLFGYGPKFFEISGMNRIRPSYLNDEWLFLTPNPWITPVLPDVGLKYADNVASNEVANDHVIIQFIGDTQLATNRAVVETWKCLRKIEMEGSSAPMVMRSFYTGFNRPDERSWLGFHDGISNVKSSDRLKVILIDKNKLNPVDYWTADGGTYMAFFRITIDMNIWESIPEKEQERIVGRQKSTGCPLIGIDKYGNNIFVPGCPVRGTLDITEKGNEAFREYAKNSYRQNFSDTSAYGVEKSHVGRMRMVPDQIFRQGYEFLEPIQTYPYFRAGLNFVSFQGGTDRIYRNIKYGFARVNFGGNHFPGADKLLAVQAAGLFLVPPFKKGEEFPGDVIFQEEKRASSSERKPIRYI